MAASGALLLGAVVTAAVVGPQDANSTTTPQAANDAGLDTFKVDKVHSALHFRIRHMDVSNFVGRFNSFDGTFQLDPDNLDQSSFQMEVDLGSVDTNSEGRNNHLKNADFFNIAEENTATFRSTEVTSVDGKRFIVRGDLTFLGKTNPVDVQMELVGIGDTRQGYKAGIDATFTFKRSDFGNMTYVAAKALGDEVTMYITMAGVRQ